MVDLKCKRCDCTYNNKCNCTAKDIKVASSTACTTYQKEEGKTNEHDETPMPLVRGNVKVRCDANCVFNDKCDCCANGITVCTENCKAECSSYVPK